MNTLIAVIDGEEQVIENVVSWEQNLGDVTNIYDRCGTVYPWGISVCSECRAKRGAGQDVKPCGKHFVAGMVRGAPGPVEITLADGSEVFAESIRVGSEE